MPGWEYVSLKGREVLDCEGRYVGVSADTWPSDGGGRPELVLVHVGRRFRRWRWVPVEGAALDGDALQLRWTLDALEDGPRAEDTRWGRPADVARAYWTLADD